MVHDKYGLVLEISTRPLQGKKGLHLHIVPIGDRFGVVEALQIGIGIFPKGFIFFDQFIFCFRHVAFLKVWPIQKYSFPIPWESAKSKESPKRGALPCPWGPWTPQIYFVGGGFTQKGFKGIFNPL